MFYFLRSPGAGRVGIKWMCHLLHTLIVTWGRERKREPVRWYVAGMNKQPIFISPMKKGEKGQNDFFYYVNHLKDNLLPNCLEVNAVDFLYCRCSLHFIELKLLRPIPSRQSFIRSFVNCASCIRNRHLRFRIADKHIGR